MAKHSKEAPEIELVPDAWPRFERFIKQVAKAGPQHREEKKGTKKREASKPTSRPRSRQKINKNRKSP
jgi:hypothetical protein